MQTQRTAWVPSTQIKKIVCVVSINLQDGISVIVNCAFTQFATYDVIKASIRDKFERFLKISAERVLMVSAIGAEFFQIRKEFIS